MLQIILLSCLFLALSTSGVKAKSLDSGSSLSDQSTALPKLVVFSFDGFRHDYVNSTDTPNLYALANDGVRGHMRSSMITKTYPNHQSIITGLYEPVHGITNNGFIDPKAASSSFNVDEPSTFWWDMNNRSVPVYIANQLYEPAIRFSGSMQWPGSIASYTDGTGRNNSHRTRVHYLQDYEKAMSFEARIDLSLDWFTHPTQPANALFLYFPEPDSTAHEYGPFSVQVKEQVKRLDDALGYFRRRLAETPALVHRTNLIVLSDHGMAQVRDSPQTVFHMEKCDQRWPGLKYEMHGVSPDFNILPLSRPDSAPKNVSLAVAVRDALNTCARELFSGKFTVYLQEDIPESFHYSGNRRILPLFLLADDGTDIMEAPKGDGSATWRPKGWPTWGNHGYNASLPSMRPLFIGQGPRFKTGYTHPTVFENVDLYPLMLHLLGIPASAYPSNGTFAHVQGMLTRTLYDGDDYLKSHLRMVDGDGQPASGPGFQWFLVFVYFGIGFCALFFAATCFVLSAGWGRGGTGSKKGSASARSSILSGRTSYREGNLLSALFSRLRRSGSTSARGSRLRGAGGNYADYQRFNSAPVRHLDSSFDTDEDDEVELYSERAIAQKKSGSRRTGASSQLTEVDWDIIGTGLDIDLHSQLGPGVKPQSKAEYSEDASSLSFVSQSFPDEPRKEFTSLLLEATDDSEEDEHGDGLRVAKNSASQLIDI